MFILDFSIAFDHLIVHFPRLDGAARIVPRRMVAESNGNWFAEDKSHTSIATPMGVAALYSLAQHSSVFVVVQSCLQMRYVRENCDQDGLLTQHHGTHNATTVRACISSLRRVDHRLTGAWVSLVDQLQ